MKKIKKKKKKENGLHNHLNSNASNVATGVVIPIPTQQNIMPNSLFGQCMLDISLFFFDFCVLFNIL